MHAKCLAGLCLGLLAAWGPPPEAAARHHRRPKDPPPVVEQPKLTLDEALARLRDPETWCAGAQALQERPADKDQAVPPLLAALGREGGDKSCLKAALAVLASRETAWRLFDAGDKARRDGLLLMEALPDDQHLPRILQVILDPDPRVRALARRALFAQNPTAAWDVVVLPLLDVEDQDLRGQAIRSVARRLSDHRVAALRARQQSETDPALKAELQQIVDGVKALP